ncbi:hypothetical protein [Spirosoma jeollabukense]
MRRRLNPWVVVLTAALTFGSLMAFVGPRFGHHRGYWGHRHGYYHGYGHDRGEAYDGDGPHGRRLAPKSDSADSQ